MTRTLADDLRQLERLNVIIHHQAADTGHLQELLELPQLKKDKPVHLPGDRARWHSARRRLRWMIAKRDRFEIVVRQALEETRSPYVTDEEEPGGF
ncbi:hypothetical protein [Deinococcus marmoris]|uniref:Uncharacterized protein n=1 Tax=Deinococcus marmoris TaxID=249408 RepID=A0A1U7P4N6_9DEIO|nr:hypothetical protein [Deinococcus marmoris]OLV20134.1 hypothetical protein BOO71_0000430 [Deinococcus marmoris]